MQSVYIYIYIYICVCLQNILSFVGCGCRICRLYLCGGVSSFPQRVSWYDRIYLYTYKILLILANIFTFHDHQSIMKLHYHVIIVKTRYRQLPLKCLCYDVTVSLFWILNFAACIFAIFQRIAGRPILMCPCVEFHRRKSLMSPVSCSFYSDGSRFFLAV